MLRAAAIAGLGLSLAAAGALAQTPSQTPSTVVVTAARPAVVYGIDRTIYNVGDDPQSQTGSAADVLANLPSVDVDLDGNPSLRGDSGVQIMINGKPAPWLNGADRGAILQQLGADAIDRIEVLTNPSAAFSPDGSAGIINIVTNKEFKPGPTGMVRANAGSEGRYNLSANGSYRVGGLDLHANWGLRDESRKRLSVTDRTNLDPLSGAFLGTSQTVKSKTYSLSQNVNLGADYDLDDADSVSLDGSYHDRSGSGVSHELDLTDAPAGDQSRVGQSQSHGADEDATAHYTHSFGGEEHQFNLDLQWSGSHDRDYDGYQYAYVTPPQPPTSSDQTARSDENEIQLKAEYTRPLPGGAKLLAGYNLQRNDDDIFNGADVIDPATGLRTPNPSMTSQYRYRQTIHSLYATYQRPLGKFGFLAGLRLEQANFTIDPLTGAPATNGGYFRVYPSLHLTYALSDSSSLKASYSLRVKRPDPGDLNPFVVVQDAFDESSGNSHLLPQQTHSFEFGWQGNDEGGSKSVTAYVRQTTDAITDVSLNVSPTLLLNTKINAGGLRSIGVDLAANGKPSDSFSYSLSGNLFYNQVKPSTPWFTGTREAFGYSGKMTLNWRPTAQDLMQLTANYNSLRLMGQGYREASVGTNLGYRRNLTGRLGAVLTVSDLFDSRGQKTLADTPFVRDRYDVSQLGRTVLIGLSYRLGGGEGGAGEDRFRYSR